MNRNYSGFWKGNIVSYNGKARTARITIPTLTDGIDDGITATFAYPVGHDDKDTEIQILAGADCYVFFEQLDPASPVIFAYSSHGTGAVTDVRRIRQENIELLAKANINIETKDTITLKAGTVIIDANVIMKKNSTTEGNNTVNGTSDLKGAVTIKGKPYDSHGHLDVENGSGTSGGVAP